MIVKTLFARVAAGAGIGVVAAVASAGLANAAPAPHPEPHLSPTTQKVQSAHAQSGPSIKTPLKPFQPGPSQPDIPRQPGTR